MADAVPTLAPAPASAAEPPTEPAPVAAPEPPTQPEAPVGPPPEVEPTTKTATEPRQEKTPEEKDANAEKQKAEVAAAPPTSEPPKPAAAPPLPVVEPDPALKPVARKFTTPAGQELTVLVPPVAPPKQDDVKPAPADVTLAKKDDVKLAGVAPPKQDDAKPAPAAVAPQASESKAPEPPAPAAPVAKETTSMVTDPTKPGVIEEKKTVIASPPAPVPAPVPSTSNTMTTVAKGTDPATDSTTTTIGKTTAPPMKAATIHEIPIREPATGINHDDLRKSKSVNEQLGLPHAPTATPLERPIGIWSGLCAKSETTLIISEHIHSWSGDDYQITDLASNKLFEVDGKVWTLSQRKHFKDMSGKILFDIRKRHLRWPRVWYIQKDDKRLAWVKGRVGIGHRHSRIHFTNTAGDGKDTELHLHGSWFAGRGAKLYLGPEVTPGTGTATADAPPPTMVADIEPQDVAGPKAMFTGKDTYKMTVAKNFDLALACMICIAVDERRSEDGVRSRNMNTLLHARRPSGI